MLCVRRYFGGSLRSRFLDRTCDPSGVFPNSVLRGYAAFLGSSSSKILPVCPIAENEALQSAAAGSLFTWDCGINPSWHLHAYGYVCFQTCTWANECLGRCLANSFHYGQSDAHPQDLCYLAALCSGCDQMASFYHHTLHNIICLSHIPGSIPLPSLLDLVLPLKHAS